jgi:hypothetical protein
MVAGDGGYGDGGYGTDCDYVKINARMNIYGNPDFWQ